MPLNIPYDAAYFSTKTADKLTELVKELTSREGEKAKKSLNYYDGKQEIELINFFNRHRKDWENDSLIPRCRNITKMVVEKSGQIIHDTPPIYDVQINQITDESATEALVDLLERADSVETWINLDEMVRLLKTVVVLVTWDDETQQLVYDLLHRGNCIVKWNSVTKAPEMLMYNLFTHDDVTSYRLILPDLIIDFDYVPSTKSITVTMQDDNPLGIVPAAQFYDTTAPRVGFWNIVPQDLTNVNEMYNVSMSDSEYAMGWMKRPTLFTNAMLADSHVEETSPYNDNTITSTRLSRTAKFPSQNFDGGTKVKFGPSAAVQLDTSGTDSPFAEFKAPVVDLKSIDEVVNQWVEAVASDWSVRATVGGTGSATSGFQLVVEELPNLELRKQRQKMFAVGLTRLFEVIKVVANMHGNTSFSDDAKLFVTYGEVSLPVETEKEEAIWSTRIENDRASLVDYFMETKGMSAEEAVEKIAEILEFNQVIKDMKPAAPTFAPAQPEQTHNSDHGDEDEAVVGDNEDEE